MADVRITPPSDTDPIEADKPLSELISQLTSDFSSLVTTHIELAKVEIKEEVSKAGKGAGLLGGGAFAGVMAVLLVSFAAAWGLAEVVPEGVAFLIVGLVWTAGVLAMTGMALDLFAMFAVVTFVGIGVDYGVHLVHRYQERGDAVRATAELAPVILVAGAITMIGYGTLVTSSYPPLRSIGVVSAVSTIALVATSVIVLPALLLSERRR